MSEIVHCKSHDEIGVGPAVSECSERYLRRLLDASAALVVVVVGRHARRAMRKAPGPESGTPEWSALDGRHVDIFFVPHPAANGRKKLRDTVSDLPSMQRLTTPGRT